MRGCWTSPVMTAAPRITVRFSLKRNGELLGHPLITYQNPNLTEDERTALHAAVAVTLARCTPLSISDALGNIIAGRPISVKLGEGRRRRTPSQPAGPLNPLQEPGPTTRLRQLTPVALIASSPGSRRFASTIAECRRWQRCAESEDDYWHRMVINTIALVFVRLMSLASFWLVNVIAQ